VCVCVCVCVRVRYSYQQLKKRTDKIEPRENMKAALVMLALVAALATASLVEHVRWEVAPAGWTRGAPPPPDTRLQLHIGVRQPRAVLESVLWAVSDPASPSYGHHLSREEVLALTKPADAYVNAVLRWLASEGVHDVALLPNGDMVQADVSVAQAEALLHARYHTWEHNASAHRVLRLAEGRYALPADVAAAVDFVGPSTRFPAVRVRRVHGQRDTRQFGNVTPKFLRKLYNVGEATASSNATVAVTGFLNQFFDPSDLASFFKQYDSESVGRTMAVVGPNQADQPGIEATLDVQYVMAMAHGAQATFWSTAGQQPGNPENEPFLKFLFDVGNTTAPPSIFSISYGDNEDTVDFDYATRVNVEFQKLGAQGITLLASSGDGGVGGGQPTSCTKFIPTFPAASPYVTAVGGTTGSAPETAASLSSGGFSNYWARPAYQDSAVAAYLANAPSLPDKSLFNATGAGFPDVAAQAENFAIVYDGFGSPVSGTSCSSPTFAGMVALLNDIRLQAGKPTLGWLNPLLYANADSFNDVTSGSNPGCGTSGYEASNGWDPVTGLGTLDFSKFSKIVSSLK